MKALLIHEICLFVPWRRFAKSVVTGEHLVDFSADRLATSSESLAIFSSLLVNLLVILLVIYFAG